MARFVSALSGSAPISLTGFYHDVRSISDGLTKRTALIASRSAVSTDIYDDLEAVYESGGGGTYFPPDTFVITNGILTGSVYTASAATTQGIRTPAEYSTRPTASILSTQTALVGPSATSDSASVNYNVYLSASNAVRATLDSITGGGPFGRLGQNPSRTLHSIYHDPNLAYFAWNDFSPGTASFAGFSVSPLLEIPEGGGGPNLGPAGFYTFITSSDNVTFTISWGTEYLADTEGTATLTLDANYVGTSGGGGASSGDIAFDATSPSPAGPYNWVISAATAFNYATGSGTFGSGYVLGRAPAVTASIQFADATIPSHAGGQVTTRTSFSSQIVRLVTLTGPRLTGSMSQTAPTNVGDCAGITTPVYAIHSTAPIPGNNPAGSNTQNYIKLFSNISTPAVFSNGVSSGQVFWLAQTNGNSYANGDQMCKYDGDSGAYIGDCITNACGT